ncbi:MULTISPECIES: hypothetical protein [unclassified Methylobacterium]|uniref:hypothetical protein n=1 Tax=unclassified Methylobacterium TaxID=2615210 RepID=UPI00226AB87A|nr:MULTISPECIES: hypothetical protein [unclassified Methylobacterium]
MRFLTTVLAAMAVCTLLLIGTAYRVGAPVGPAPSTGLTAATVLGTDGMPSASGPSETYPEPVAAAGRADGATSGDQG